MANIRILLQGLTPDDDHDSAVNDLLRLPDMERFLFSLAFVRRNGVERIAGNLAKIADNVTIFMGIRNGITSVQSIFSLLRIGILPYVVDTSATNKIFHPKIYAAYGEKEASLILGSANLTFGGLNQNIEASSLIDIDRSVKADEEYLAKLETVLLELPKKYPDHVFQITNPRDAVQLLKEGRLEDERIVRLPATTKPQKNRERDKLPPIPTYSKRAKKPSKAVKRPRTSPRVGKVSSAAVLMWESKPLSERSLNIPRSGNTHPTGDTNLGQGLMVGIDFQTYFRDVVFTGLAWSVDPTSASPHLERAQINVELIIKNISYGMFSLEVTHDPRTNTRSYQQRNVMTKIKWGDARTLIAKPDLLDRTLKLYQRTPTEFILVID